MYRLPAAELEKKARVIVPRLLCHIYSASEPVAHCVHERGHQVRQARQLIVAARRCLQDIVIGFGKYLDRVVGLPSARERRPQNRDNLLNWSGTVQLPEDRENRAIEFLPQRHPSPVASNPRRMFVRRNAPPGRHISE